MNKNGKSIYMPPLVSKVAEVETENSVLIGSIIPDDQEVVIDKQEKEDDVFYTTWE